MSDLNGGGVFHGARKKKERDSNAFLALENRSISRFNTMNLEADGPSISAKEVSDKLEILQLATQIDSTRRVIEMDLI